MTTQLQLVVVVIIIIIIIIIIISYDRGKSKYVPFILSAYI